jgi:hypothetical protein
VITSYAIKYLHQKCICKFKKKKNQIKASRDGGMNRRNQWQWIKKKKEEKEEDVCCS